MLTEVLIKRRYLESRYGCVLMRSVALRSILQHDWDVETLNGRFDVALVT